MALAVSAMMWTGDCQGTPWPVSSSRLRMSSRRFEAVHFRHLAVHENQRDKGCVRSASRTSMPLPTASAEQPSFFSHAERDLLVHRVVFGHEDARACELRPQDGREPAAQAARRASAAAVGGLGLADHGDKAVEETAIV